MGNFHFYRLGEEQQFNFYQVPKALFNPPFEKMSNDSRLLYALLRDRMLLSSKNGWTDHDGNIFIIYSIEDITKDMSCGKNSAVKYLKELEESGLVVKKRQGMGLPTKIYVCNFASPISKDLKESQNVNFKNPKKQTSRIPKNGNSEVYNSDSNDTETNDINNNDIIHPSTIVSNIKQDRSIDGLESRNFYRDLIHKNIGYDFLVDRNQWLEEKLAAREIGLNDYERQYTDISILNQVIGYMLDYICSPAVSSVTINDDKIPREVLKAKLLKTDSQAILSAVSVLKHNETIRNPKKYAISMLYNARVLSSGE